MVRQINRLSYLILLTGFTLVSSRLLGTEISGTLATDTILTSAGSPWTVPSDIVVPQGVTLQIDPGVTLQFDSGAGIRVETGGKLQAEGTEQERILMTRTPENTGTWDGIEFQQTMEENLLSHVDMEHGDGRSNWIHVQHSKLLAEAMNWQQTNKTVIEVDHPSLLVKNCNFPNVGSVETIHGQTRTGKEYLIVEGNVFGSTLGYNDVIDFSDCRRPGPVFEVYNNIFHGGADDALDLDGCDSHIEGNVFMNFHKGNNTSSTSNALATGEYNGHSPTIVAARNVFVNNDHAILLKEGTYLRADNNVFVNSVYGAINYSEWPDRTVDPGKGADLTGNIFWNNGSTFQNQFAQPGKQDPVIVVNDCLIPVDLQGLGVGNWFFDPKFVQPDSNFHLQPTSPAIGLGPNGLDMGAYVPEGASISGEPDSVTPDTTAILTIGGPGIIAYCYALNDTANGWSEVFDLETNPTIQLTGFQDGQTYKVIVKGKNSAGRWRAAPRESKTWRVDRNQSAVKQDAVPNPSSPILYPAYPNPFNPETMLSYSIPHDGLVKLAVYDLLGKTVRVLVNRRLDTGRHQIVWDGRDGTGRIMPGGVYFVRFKSDGFVQTRKIVMVK